MCGNEEESNHLSFCCCFSFLFYHSENDKNSVSESTSILCQVLSFSCQKLKGKNTNQFFPGKEWQGKIKERKKRMKEKKGKNGRGK